jgi:AbrB family looped-hinge helix DNA binding protein
MKNSIVTLQEGGQITLPKRVRDELRLQPGAKSDKEVRTLAREIIDRELAG